MTLGDPRGIGTEITVAALPAFLNEFPQVEVILLGADDRVAEATTTLSHPRVTGEGVGPAGGSDAVAGSVSVEAIRQGVATCLAGEATALVTGPVHKPSLHAAGVTTPGQTEFLQSLTGAPDVGMLMATERSRLEVPLRILLATTHLPLRDVADALDAPRLRGQLRLLADGLRHGWQIEAPRIALCALNPHASDGGLFGDEEALIMAPVVEELRREGLDLRGPIPADSVFRTLLTGDVDGIVVPYHDVGMAVFKTLAFGRGVNVTLGLPFLRTSPDHGTAFDIVGTGKASPDSTLEALRLAARLGPGLFQVGTSVSEGNK